LLIYTLYTVSLVYTRVKVRYNKICTPNDFELVLHCLSFTANYNFCSTAIRNQKQTMRVPKIVVFATLSFICIRSQVSPKRELFNQLMNICIHQNSASGSPSAESYRRRRLSSTGPTTGLCAVICYKYPHHPITTTFIHPHSLKTYSFVL
jgi:hypothetical protein